MRHETKFSNEDGVFTLLDSERELKTKRNSLSYGCLTRRNANVRMLVILVSIATLVALMTVTAIVMRRSDSNNDNTDNSTVLCYSCARLERLNQGSSTAWHDFITRQKDGQCCIADMKQGFDALLQRLEGIPDPFMTRVDEMAGCVQAVNRTSTAPNNTDDGTSTSPPYPTVYQKSAIHLQGTFDNTTGRMIWINRVHPCGIALTRDSMAIRIGASGTYYMYGNIFFTARVTSRTTHFMYQQSRNGVAKIQHLEKYSFPQGETNNEVCSIERVVHLYKGDKLFVTISSDQTQKVSTEPDIHVWGMFEI